MASLGLNELTSSGADRIPSLVLQELISGADPNPFPTWGANVKHM